MEAKNKTFYDVDKIFVMGQIENWFKKLGPFYEYNNFVLNDFLRDVNKSWPDCYLKINTESMQLAYVNKYATGLSISEIYYNKKIEGLQIINHTQAKQYQLAWFKDTARTATLAIYNYIPDFKTKTMKKEETIEANEKERRILECMCKMHDYTGKFVNLKNICKAFKIDHYAGKSMVDLGFIKQLGNKRGATYTWEGGLPNFAMVDKVLAKTKEYYKLLHDNYQPKKYQTDKISENIIQAQNTSVTGVFKLYKDSELFTELERRGYEVTAKKLITYTYETKNK